jgi:membrane protease YdiL (CAAX protease family)
LRELQSTGRDRETLDGTRRADLLALIDLYERGPGALAPGSRKALIDRYDWFGRLALVHGLPPDDPERRAVVRPAVRTAVVAIVASVAALGGLAAGVVLLIVGVVLWSNGRLTFAYRRAPRPTGPFLEAFAAYLAGMVLISLGVSLLTRRTLGSTWFLLAIIPVAFFWPLVRGVPWTDLRHGLGWTAGRGWLREVGAGLLGYVAGLPLLAAGAVVTLFLQRLSGADTTHPIVNEITRGGTWRVVQLFLLAAVWAPVVEETMFRGAFYHHLRGRLPWPLAAAFVGVLFAAIHPQGWAAIPVLGAIGFSFAAMREWRGSIIAPAVAHAINNGVMTVLLLLMMT